MNSVLANLTAVANIIIALTLVVVAGIWLAIALGVRSAVKKLTPLLDRLGNDVAPILTSVKGISENVHGVTTTVRKEVDKVTGTVDMATDRVQHAISLSEERINQFNALLEVVQDEAERLFLSTASTVRGARRGAAAFRGRDGTDFASDELDAAAWADARLLPEERDGYDRSTEPPTPALSAAPRVRPRPRGRRRA